MSGMSERQTLIYRVRRVECPWCRAQPQQPCEDGRDHLMRWTRARRKGLVTEDELRTTDVDARSDDGAPMVAESVAEQIS